MGGAWPVRMMWWVIGIWALLWAVLLLSPISSYDIWWQLDSGRWMLDHGSVLREEIRSLADAGTPWNNFTWLFQVLVAAVYEIGGMWGLLILKGFLWGLLLLVSAASSVHSRTALLPWLVVTLGIAATLTGFMYLRPHLLAASCLLAVVFLLHQPLNRRTQLAWGLLLLFWANVHASVVVGVVAMGLHLLLLPGLGGLRPKPLKHLLMAMVLGCTAFLTPNGLDLIHLLFEHAGSEIVQRYIVEWQQASFPPATRLVVVLGVFGLIRHWRRLSWGEMFLMAFFAYMASKNVRFLFELTLVSIRPAVELLSDGWQALAAQRLWQRRLFAVVGLAGVFIVAEVPECLSSRRTSLFPVALSKYPVATAVMANAASERLGRPIRVFNGYGFGGYLEWTGDGKIATFIDGRTPTIYPQARLMEHMLGFAKAGIIEELDRKYGFDGLVLNRRTTRNKDLDRKEWQLVGFDEATSFYLKAHIAKLMGWKAITFDPSKLDMPDDTDELASRIKELRSVLQWDDSNFLAHVQLGLALLKQAEIADSDRVAGIAELEKAVAERPYHVVVNFLLGRALWEAGEDKEAAMKYFRVALANHGGKLQPRRLAELADIYLAARQPEKALEVLGNSQTRARALDSNYTTWLTRATAQAVLERPEKAAESLYFASLLAQVRGEDICDAFTAISNLLPEATAKSVAKLPCRPTPASPTDNATPGN
jgi:tetratricopeptide (TPR) repeat protein